MSFHTLFPLVTLPLLLLSCSGGSSSPTIPVADFELEFDGQRDGVAFAQACGLMEDASSPGDAEADCRFATFRCISEMEDGTEVLLIVDTDMSRDEPQTVDYAMCEEGTCPGVTLILGNSHYSPRSSNENTYSESPVNEVVLQEAIWDTRIVGTFAAQYQRGASYSSMDPFDVSVTGSFTLDCTPDEPSDDSGDSGE